MTEPKERHDNKKISVFGLFHDEGALAVAVEALKSVGFRAADISALLPDMRTGTVLAHEKHTKAPEGAAAGATAGGLAGGALGLLIGLGAVVIPGLGAVLAAGPIVAALAGVGAGGAVGTLAGALIGMGIPEYEAKRYESFLDQGGALVSVHCDDQTWARRAKSLLDGFGATDVSDGKEVSARRRHDRHHPA